MDSARIAEVLKQLLENAAKYSAAESPITITAELRDSQLVTSVSDQGPGIDDFEQSPGLRQVLSRPRSALSSTGHRDGPGDRQGNCGSPWRHSQRNQPTGARIGLLLRTSRGVKIDAGLLFGTPVGEHQRPSQVGEILRFADCVVGTDGLFLRLPLNLFSRPSRAAFPAASAPLGVC